MAKAATVSCLLNASQSGALCCSNNSLELCDTIFCPQWSLAVTPDPLANGSSATPDVFLATGLAANLTSSMVQRRQLNMVIALDVSSSMSTPFDQYPYPGQNLTSVGVFCFFIRFCPALSIEIVVTVAAGVDSDGTSYRIQSSTRPSWLLQNELCKACWTTSSLRTASPLCCSTPRPACHNLWALHLA